jgi:hypothetical protein
VQEHLCDLPYEEKIKIYDDKCNGCGFAQIVVKHKFHNANNFVTNNVQEAVHIARMTESSIERSCVYPPDMEVVFGQEIPVSLLSIIINGCMFWNDKKMDCYSREETEFIEVEAVEQIDVRKSERVISAQ